MSVAARFIAPVTALTPSHTPRGYPPGARARGAVRSPRGTSVTQRGLQSSAAHVTKLRVDPGTGDGQPECESGIRAVRRETLTDLGVRDRLPPQQCGIRGARPRVED